MELSILHYIQTLHNSVLDKIMVFVSTISNHGDIWILAAAIMLCFKKGRKCGIATSISLLMALLIGNVFLKNFISRDRPSWIDNSVILLISNPTDFSFPSGHTFSSFAAAVTIFIFHRKPGIPAVILAFTIAFSRLYLFVHYPSDVLAGMILGTITAVISYRLVNYIYVNEESKLL